MDELVRHVLSAVVEVAVKRRIQVLVVCVLAVVSLAFTPRVARAEIASGTCGTCVWPIDDDGCLTIAPADGASGVLEPNTNSVYDHWPWYASRSQVTSARFEDGVSLKGSAAYVFYGCSSLASLDFTEFDSSSVTDMGHMFYGCKSLTSLDLSPLDTSSVTDMRDMFYDCSSLETIRVGDAWVTGTVTESTEMLSGCTSLVGGNGTVYDPNHVDVEYARVDAPGTLGYLTYAGTSTTHGTVDLRYNEWLTVHRGEPKTGTTIPVQWDDSWFARLRPAEYDPELHEMATTASMLSSAAYDESLVRDDLEKLGFDVVICQYSPHYEQHYHHVAYCLAVKDVTVDGETFPLVAVVVRGTPGNCEWESNFHVTSDPDAEVIDHEGFWMAASELEFDLLMTIRDRGIDLGKARFLVTGHSCVAAVANLVAQLPGDGRAWHRRDNRAPVRRIV